MMERWVGVAVQVAGAVVVEVVVVVVVPLLPQLVVSAAEQPLVAAVEAGIGTAAAMWVKRLVWQPVACVVGLVI